jgi:hypothetical protein
VPLGIDGLIAATIHNIKILTQNYHFNLYNA